MTQTPAKEKYWAARVERARAAVDAIIKGVDYASLIDCSPERASTVSKSRAIKELEAWKDIYGAALCPTIPATSPDALDQEKSNKIVKLTVALFTIANGHTPGQHPSHARRMTRDDMVDLAQTVLDDIKI